MKTAYESNPNTFVFNGAQKAKFKDELPEVGAKKYAQQMPLDVRQKVSTSESKRLWKY